MGSVVSDSSVLIHLASIGQLGLLREIFECITVPPAVWREVVLQGRGISGALEVERARQAGWIQVVEPVDAMLLRLLKRDLDDGEAETIALGIEQGAALVLVDETDARAVADLYEMSKTGTIGLLIRAKQEGHIDSLGSALDRLRHQGGFWIEERLYDQALDAVREAHA